MVTAGKKASVEEAPRWWRKVLLSVIMLNFGKEIKKML